LRRTGPPSSGWSRRGWESRSSPPWRSARPRPTLPCCGWTPRMPQSARCSPPPPPGAACRPRPPR
jgi:hypothetical protein